MKVLGDYSYNVYIDLINALIDEDLKKILDILNYIFETGDPRLFVNQFFNLVLEITKYVIFGNINATKLPITLEEDVQGCINFDNPVNYFNYLIDKMLELKNNIKGEIDINNSIIATFIQMSRLK